MFINFVWEIKIFAAFWNVPILLFLTYFILHFRYSKNNTWRPRDNCDVEAIISGKKTKCLNILTIIVNS